MVSATDSRLPKAVAYVRRVGQARAWSWPSTSARAWPQT
jgi:hypothetical protein